MTLLLCSLALVLVCLPLVAEDSRPGIDASSWTWSDPTSGEKGDFPGGAPIAIQRGGGSSLVLESRFSLPESWSGPLGIVLYKNNMAFRLYVNGEYVETIGRMGPDFFFEPYVSSGVLVGHSLLKPGENSLRLEAFNDTGSFKLRMISLLDEASFKGAMASYGFLDVQFPRMCCVFLLFVTLYLLFYFWNYREKKESLYLALSALFFAAYLLNVTIEDAPGSYLRLKALLYSCFPLSMLFLFSFFRSFFSMRTGKRAMLLISLAGLAFAAGYWFQRDTAALDRWHSLMLAYPVASLVYAFVGAIRGLRKGEARSENIVILVGLLVAVGFSAYDMYYFFADRTPFILLQGPGIMTLIIATFYSFSQEIATTNRRVLAYSAEMERNKKARDELFASIRAATEKSESASSVLAESIDRVGALVTQYISNVESINGDIETQNGQISSNKRNVEEIFWTINATSEMVGEHARLVEAMVGNIKELDGHIQATDGLVKRCGDTIRKLTGVCLAADKEVAESAKFVSDLASYSDNINAIVASISDLAEKTNVLSINAAIEAARSGSAGKGFSVVAGEIRSLAARSSESATQIDGILRTMVEKIRKIKIQEELVSRSLKEIVAENGNMDGAIGEVVLFLEKQLEASARIGEAVEELVATVARISGQAKSQEASGEGLKDSMETLDSLCASILLASKEQRACNDELTANLQGLKTVSSDHSGVIADLRGLLSSC